MRIYFDHNAATPLHPAARAAMVAALDQTANPSSLHGPGRAAREQIERARAAVAGRLGADADEILFCSGGTEADNLAIRGAARAVRRQSGRATVVSSPLEHPAVLASLAALEEEGFRVRWLPVDGDGGIDPGELARRVDGDTALVTLSLANHEIGALYPIDELAAIAHRAGALLHSDAVQAIGRTPIDVRALAVDLLSVSSHKLAGPQGAGALFVRRGVDLAPLIVGGHQERERRPGTENLPALVGFAAACVQAAGEGIAAAAAVARLRDRLEAGALAIPGARRFGAAVPRLPNTASLGFTGAPGHLVMVNLDLAGVAVATGAACTSGSVAPSAVIRALGVDDATAASAVRFSLGRDNTEAEVDYLLSVLPSIVDRIRGALTAPATAG